MELRMRRIYLKSALKNAVSVVRIIEAEISEYLSVFCWDGSYSLADKGDLPIALGDIKLSFTRIFKYYSSINYR